METLRKKIKELTIQDLVTFLICALSIYLLRARETHYLNPCWWKDADDSHISDEEEYLPVPHSLRPRPIITDLDGDGSMEVVMVTQNLKLEVLSPMVVSATAQLPRLNPLLVTPIEGLDNEDRQVAFPVAIETGYFDSIQKEHKYRKQVIVLVLDDWTVLCYDHNLNLLWKQKVLDLDQLKETHRVKSMAILISSHSVEKNDKGMVVVGGSFSHKSHDTRNMDIKEAEAESARKPLDATPHEEDPYSHFSTFALSGANGTVRWHHLPGDFHARDPEPDNKFHHWKLSLRRTQYHTGEVHWTNYGENILKHTPHSWEDLRDTRFDLAHLKKLEKQSQDSEPEGTILSDIIDFSHSHILGMAYGGLPPHSRHEHVRRPNAVIAHNHEGIEVLNLDTGRPLTRIRLSKPKTTFVDINEDSTLEQVQVNFNDDNCEAEVSTVYPRPKALFRGPLCETPRFLGAMSFTSLFNSLPSAQENTHLAVTPVAVKSVAHRTGFINHVMGYSLSSSRVGYDNIYLTSTGRLTSYGPRGEFNWQSIVPIQWSEMTRSMHYMNDDIQHIYHNIFRPSMIPMSSQVYGKVNVMLILGWDSVALVDLRDGYVMAEHSLPCQPVDKPITEDLNDDGWTDFIVSCPNGYIGFTVTRQPSYLYMALMSITVVLTVLLLSWCCKPDPMEETDY